MSSATAAPITEASSTGPDRPDPQSRAAAVLLVGGALFCLTPWASAPGALALGLLIALTLGNPLRARTGPASKLLLQASVVGLGFGMSLGAVLRAGASGVGYTVAGIALALTLGLLLGRWLEVEREASWLITAGTSICGGSAIAAVGGAIRAREEAMSVSLATVFVLNAVALYLFPPVGRWLHLSEHQFAVWAAVAIHDTSSVVGAATAYGQRALQDATVLKLARALWIVPLALGASALARRREGVSEGKRPPAPWFIGLFLLAAVVRSLLPATTYPALDGLARLARVGLVLTLFLIGAGLTRSTLRAVGLRPMLQGVLLWAILGVTSLAAILAWVPAT
jgi:uncharacterized integral membrane protein (TIGR00698 family)